jgi:hypothetical protein
MEYLEEMTFVSECLTLESLVVVAQTIRSSVVLQDNAKLVPATLGVAAAAGIGVAIFTEV